jgi:thiazole/oxazole-forming peptide maturase SagD family component
MEYDDEKEFVSRVNSYLDDKVIMYKDSVFDESFPPIQRSSLSFVKGPISLHSGACGWGEDIFPKVKGEFLERVSTYLPIDDFIKSDFDVEVVKNSQQKKLTLKSVLGFRFLRIFYREVYFLFKGENSKKQVTTSGCAGHFSYDEATLNAWLELIQRDAFFVHWLNTIPPTHIDIDNFISKSEKLRRVIILLQRYNLQYYFLDVTTDIAVPSCVCVLVDHAKTGKKVGIGASAGLGDVEDILFSALNEALIILGDYYKEQPSMKLDNNCTPFIDKTLDRKKRLGLYMDNANFEKFKFFISSTKRISVEDFTTVFGTLSEKISTTEQLDYLKKIFGDRYKSNSSYDVFVAKIRNKLLNEFDYKVVRVMCDALYPLYLNENYANPNHPRLKEFVKNKRLESVAKLNIWPHPFP